MKTNSYLLKNEAKTNEVIMLQDQSRRKVLDQTLANRKENDRFNTKMCGNEKESKLTSS